MKTSTQLQIIPVLMLVATLLGVTAAEAAPDRMNQPNAVGLTFERSKIKVSWNAAQVGSDGAAIQGYCVRQKTNFSNWGEASCENDPGERSRTTSMEFNNHTYYASGCCSGCEWRYGRVVSHIGWRNE